MRKQERDYRREDESEDNGDIKICHGRMGTRERSESERRRDREKVMSLRSKDRRTEIQ